MTPSRKADISTDFSPLHPVQCQVIMTKDKELVLSEKKMRAGFGATLVTSFSDVIESKDFRDFESFAAEV